MTRDDEMVEAVARAICAVNCGGCGVIDRRTATCGDGWQACTNEARAALAAIAPMIREQEREDAARVVLNWSLPTMQTPSMWLIDKQGIAAAIRAMGEKP